MSITGTLQIARADLGSRSPWTVFVRFAPDNAESVYHTSVSLDELSSLLRDLGISRQAIGVTLIALAQNGRHVLHDVTLSDEQRQRLS